MQTAGPTHLTRRSPGRTMWTLAGTAIRRFIAAGAAERHVRRAIRELETFDDHRLRDLGLTRVNFERLVRFGRDADTDVPRAARVGNRAIAADPDAPPRTTTVPTATSDQRYA
jgi:uncharacterized protein YjiS (DUF1127 family)